MTIDRFQDLPTCPILILHLLQLHTAPIVYTAGCFSQMASNIPQTTIFYSFVVLVNFLRVRAKEWFACLHVPNVINSMLTGIYLQQPEIFNCCSYITFK